MARSATKPTEEERAARRREDRDRLEQAARALLTSEGWQRWVDVRSALGLRKHCLLIASERYGAACEHRTLTVDDLSRYRD